MLINAPSQPRNPSRRMASSANEPSRMETLSSARRSIARREVESRLRNRTEYFLSATSLDFSCGLVGPDEAGAGRLVGLIVRDGYDESAGVARRAGFPGPVGASGRLDAGLAGQGKASRSRCHAREMAVAHRQVASMRRSVWRAPRVMRAATCRTR